MTKLTISLLGNPKIELDSTPVTVDTRKAIALLAYLAVTGESHSRDHLTALLWPDFDTSRGRAALRRTLSSLKKAVLDRILVAGDSIDLDRTEDFWFDIDEFLTLTRTPETHDHPPDQFCAACREPLSQAESLYRGDFLEGFGLRDSAEFDDWQLYQGESLRREFGSALSTLVRIELDAGEFDQALGSAHRWLALDTLNEEAHRQIMLAYARSGQRAAALRQYEECRQLLDRELGVPPLDETVKLHEQIRDDQLPPEASDRDLAAEVETPRSTPTYPLVGRRSAWEGLTSVYRSIKADGGFVLIQGEAGIGKTRLAQEFIRNVEAQGGKGIALRSYEGETSLAYAPVLAGLRAYLTQSQASQALEELPPATLSEAARLLPEIHEIRADLPPAPPMEGPGAQSRFLESLSTILASASSGPSPGVIFLDDLQWVDGATLDFLTYLAHRLNDRPLLLIAALRSEASAQEPRLGQLVVEAQQGGSNAHIVLDRLAPDDLRDLLMSTEMPDLGVQFEDRLYRETEGLPFFIVEYLAMVEREMEAGQVFDWPMPSGVRDLLHSRLTAVPEMPMQLLTTAAVVGRSFDFDTLRTASGRSEEEAVTGLEDLTRMRLIMEVSPDDAPGNPVYDFSHEQLRTLVYDEVSLARRRLLHRRVGEALQTRSRRTRQEAALSGLIAQHLQLGGQESEAADYYFRAGEYARAVYANEEAIEQYRLALGAGHPDPAGLHEAIGDLETLNGQYRSALRSYESAGAGSTEANLAVLEHKMGTVYHRLGEWSLAESHFWAGLAALEAQGATVEQAQVLADWSLNAYRQGDEAEALKHIEAARELAEAAEDPRALAQVYNILGILARARGDLEEARSCLERSLAQSEAMNDLSAQIAALNNLALVSTDRDELDEARTCLLEAQQLCVKLGDRHREAALYNNLADLSQRADEPEAAMEYLKKAVSLFAEVGLDAGELQPEIWKLVEW